jgi:hypothetical protein
MLVMSQNPDRVSNIFRSSVATMRANGIPVMISTSIRDLCSARRVGRSVVFMRLLVLIGGKWSTPAGFRR